MLPTKTSQIASNTLESQIPEPLSKRDQLEESQLPISLDSKTETDISSSPYLNLIRAKPFMPDPLSSKAMLNPLYGGSSFGASNLMFANILFQDQSQKVLLNSLNMSLYVKLNNLLSERTNLLSRIKECEEQQKQLSPEAGTQKSDSRKKRNRRMASQIIRLYKCPESSCKKSYGSEFSLTQHLKTKHSEKFDELQGQIKKSVN